MARGALFSLNVAFVLATGNDAPVWPTHYTSFFLIALGIATLGLAALRRRVVPAAVAVAMIAPPFVMPLRKAQEHRVLLWLPLGLASLALGFALASRHGGKRGLPLAPS